ncbi:AMP-binding protein [Gammaproteobacteria bacterium]|nr:AMP-binding protein [Gammaproteobacteria bacterium]
MSELGFYRFANSHPDEIAIVEPSEKIWTRGELLAKTNQLTHALKEFGVKSGDVVATVLPNSVEYYIAYLACAQSGFYMVPINWHLAGPEIAYILEDSGAKAFIASGEVPAMEDACQKAVSAINFPENGCISTTQMSGFTHLDDFISSQPIANPEDRTAGQVMNYTSGTTGKPKGVKRALIPGDPDDVLSMFAMILSFFEIQPQENNVHIVGSPLYHTAVLVHSSAALHYGHSVVLMEKFDAEQMLYLIDKYKVTTSHMVPTQFHRLLQLPDEIRAKYDCSSTRAMIHAAAPCPIHTKQAMIEWWGNSIWEYYAATEGGGTVVDADSWSKFPGTVGKAWPGAEIKIINENGTEAKPDDQGTVFMKLGEATKFEYKGDQAKTKKERLIFDDQVYFTDEGYLFLCDRKIDMIISGGANIYPAEIESAFLMHPAVADVAVFGIPNEEWGEEVKAVVELNQNFDSSNELLAELMNFAQENLAKMKLPRSIDFIEKLPRDENGKLYKRRLRDPYWENHSSNV